MPPIEIHPKIDEFRGKWSVIEKRENRYLKELRRTATIESIGSSTRIEGAREKIIFCAASDASTGLLGYIPSWRVK